MKDGDEDEDGGEALLWVPGLAERRAIGSGCCFLLAGDMLDLELRGWRGVRDLVIDDSTGLVRLVLSSRHPPIEDLVACVRDLGFEQVTVLRFPSPGPSRPRRR